MIINRTKRFLAEWVLPPGVLRIYQKIKKQPNSKVTDIIFETCNFSDLKNKHNGERCFILASGPSINLHNLEYLKDEHCIAVSQFFLHEQINTIKPEYHCLAPQHHPFKHDTNKIIFDNFTNSYKIKPKLFIGNTQYEFSYHNFLQKHKEYNIDVKYIDYSVNYGINENNYMDERVWDLQNNPFYPRTVVYTALQLAYFLGFKEIYLLGVDHDYINELGRKNHHFYNEDISYDDGKHLESFTTEKWFEEYYIRWKQYRLMKQFLTSKGVKIFNASKKSLLDVFEKTDYGSLFNS